MRRFNTIFAFALVAGVSLAVLCFAFQASSTEPAVIPSEVCLDCHEDAPRALMGTAHDPLAKKLIACASCHVGPATAMHVDDPDTYKPIIPANLPADSLSAVCTACHKNPHALNMYERDPHIEADLSCDACHKIHNNNDYPALLKASANTVCLDCHASARSDFALPTHHPVMEGVVECRDCHIEIAQSPKQRTAGGPAETCVACHGRMQGPFPYEHEPAVNYAVNDGGCLNCHNPHGSVYPMLLKQSYESPHFSLCSQCHAVPKHLNNMQHGTQWAGVACSDCHVDVHGSYVNRNLLDPSLGAQGCFQGGGGCHKF
jgi:DmsE family decaheme c-type cytochrome